MLREKFFEAGNNLYSKRMNGYPQRLNMYPHSLNKHSKRKDGQNTCSRESSNVSSKNHDGSLRIFLLQFFQSFQSPLVPEQQLVPFIEILLEDNADALRSQVGLGIIAVVCFIVSLQPDIP